MRQNYVHTHSKWFAKDVSDVAKHLETNPAEGLRANEAQARQNQFGPNMLPAAKKSPTFLRFIKHFHDILIYILFVAAFVTLVLHHYADTIVILLVTVINACIGFFQENKAEKALEDIKAMLSHKASVIRGGERLEVDAAELTLGDVVLLAPGDKVPADLRLLRADNLKIEESALTGEALPASKQTAPVDTETMLGDRSNMAYCGTTVRSGTGAGIVVAIGLETEIGHISQLIADTGAITTPLIRQMQQFGKTISIIIVVIAAAVFLFGHFYREYSTTELLLATIGLAIAAIPEGLPAILSIILAIGVQNMAKRNAIVRTLPSVETLGSVSVICSDKTGTLTKNEMTVQALVTRDALFDVSGTGYAPEGQITEGGVHADTTAQPLLTQMLRCFRICNDSALARDENKLWQVNGDPTEGALLTLYEKAGIAEPLETRLATLPFDSEYKYMATLIDSRDGALLLIKGAPDRLLDMAALEQKADGTTQPLDRAYWEDRISELAGRGQRVIGAALKPVPAGTATITHDDVHDGIVFLGLAGIMDPPRDEAAQAIRACHAAGIEVKMITGDHADTAAAIGQELGIAKGHGALLGRAIDEMTEEQLETAAQTYNIFARTSPEHKLRLVKALQNKGAICAMTGDGVNDAPALKTADVGIAMGIKGTEVTKDSAEIILADDNFSTIVAAVEEGRRVYDNLKKTILFILPTNGAQGFLIIASILFGTLLPVTPLQILWVNMVSAVTISMALAFEKVEPDAMERPPRNAGESLLSGYFIWRVLFVSVLIGGLTLISNIVLMRYGFPENLVRTSTLQTIVLCQMFHLFNSQSIRRSAFATNPFANRAVPVVCGILLVLQLIITYAPFMNRIFDTVPLSLPFWLLTLALGLIVFLVVEGEKWVMRTLEEQRGR